MLQTAALERDIEFQKARVQRLQGRIIASHEFTQQSDQSINTQEEHLAQIEAEMAELKQIADAAGAGTLVPDLIILLNQSTVCFLSPFSP
jgi:septal ring factor EnvC (AmiA/AmiB activator)